LKNIHKYLAEDEDEGAEADKTAAFESPAASSSRTSKLSIPIYM
jgi:hypothetical protein